jgi:cytochrome aa3-600 menaquinol oxidase subunit 2
LTEKNYINLLKPSNLGRETFSNTHLDWVNHADMNAKIYTFPELYRNHDYPGEIFKEPDNQKMQMDGKSMDMNSMDMSGKSNGGEHNGH